MTTTDLPFAIVDRRTADGCYSTLWLVHTNGGARRATEQEILLWQALPAATRAAATARVTEKRKA